jgi:hypothetical protein
MSVPRRLAAVALTALLLGGVAGLAQAPYDPPGAEDAVLRLSGRYRGERVERCRDRTAEELAALPAHMRTPQLCEGSLLAYHVIIRVDDAAPDTLRVLPGGARGDRPIFVFREVRLEPGTRRIRVVFEPTSPAGVQPVEPLLLERVLDAAPGAVHLVTLDAVARSLVHRMSSAPAGSPGTQPR